MHALHFGLPLVLSASVALCGFTAYARNPSPILTQERTDHHSREFDQQLNDMLTALIESAKIGPDGLVFVNPGIVDGHFFEPYSGRYWQVSGQGRQDLHSRSLWDRELQLSGRKAWTEPIFYDSHQFANEPLRIIERTVRLPGSDTEWQFVVARTSNALN